MITVLALLLGSWCVSTAHAEDPNQPFQPAPDVAPEPERPPEPPPPSNTTPPPPAYDPSATGQPIYDTTPEPPATYGASGQPPAAYGASAQPPPAAYGQMYGPPPGQYGYGYQLQQAQYDAESKSVALAVILDLLIPGVGNIYASAPLYAVATWVGLVGGMALMFSGIGDAGGSSDATQISLGIGLFLGSYIFGIVTAGMNASSYNDELRARLGMRVALGPTPDGRGGLLALDTRF